MPLSADFFADPRAFCQLWVIRMPGDQAGGVGIQNLHATFLNDSRAKQQGATMNVGYNIAAAPTDVCWHEYFPGRLELVVRNSAQHNLMTAPLNDWFEAFLLPWGAGKVTRMELPNQPAAAPNKVRAFFTAEMNGCAFLVAGNSKSPVVAHLNVNAMNFATAQAKEAELDRMVTSAVKLSRGGPNIGGKTGAVLHWKPSTTNPAAPTLGTTLARRGGTYGDSGAEITSFDQVLTADTAAQERKFYTAPTTDIRIATMGVMNPTDSRWQFFYQRNYCTNFSTVKKIGNLGVVKDVFGDWRTPRRENYYARLTGSEYILIWPVGAGVVPIPAHGDPTQ
jgi:hypothetical protein